ncbi:Hypothetical predicted protein, partial [Scomber scombrus]
MAARPMLAAASANTEKIDTTRQTLVTKASSLSGKAVRKKQIYNREFLLGIRNHCADLRPRKQGQLRKLGLLRLANPDPTADPTAASAGATQRRTRQRCDRTQKRGKHGG